MKRIKVKFCGLKSLEDAKAVSRFSPDYAGVILSPGFRRSVDAGTAAEIRKALHPGIRLAGVFVHEGYEQILESAEEAGIDIIQLHGEYEEEEIRILKEKGSLPVWKAFAVQSESDLEKAAGSMADLVLLDGKKPGSGSAFDWELLERLDRAFILAGGLSPENVSEALRTGAACLDVSSGIETEGKKDPEKMAAFMHAVEAALAESI